MKDLPAGLVEFFKDCTDLFNLEKNVRYSMPYKTIKTVKVTLQALVILALAGCDSKDQHLSEPVKIIGEMKNVMWKGELDGNIHLDTITNKTHLYGLGPIEYLRGEILILDGKAYRSTIVTEEIMQVEESYDLKGPFFAYTHISQWREQTLPDLVETMHQLEQYLDQVTQSAMRPFMFRLSGTVAEALIHVVNLPEGSAVREGSATIYGEGNNKVSWISLRDGGIICGSITGKSRCYQ